MISKKWLEEKQLEGLLDWINNNPWKMAGFSTTRNVLDWEEETE